MVKKIKSKKKSSLNTDLDNGLISVESDENTDFIPKIEGDDLSDIEPPIEDLSDNAVSDDTATYTMGDIQVAAGGDDDVSEKEEFNKASKIVKDSDKDLEEDDEWVEEDISTEDTDPFQDMEDFDMDNPYREDDY